MSTAFKVITPPSVEPISLTDAKAYLRVDFSDDDAVIANLITRARSYAETVTHRALCTQTIQCVETIERPSGGVLSGPIVEGPNWYQFQQQIGANPFGAAQFYVDLPMPPIQASQTLTIETKVTAFDTWTAFTGVTYLDDVQEPARLYFMDPLTVNFWRFTFTSGYYSGYPIPPGLLQPIYESIAFWYNNREAEDLPQYILNKLLARR